MLLERESALGSLAAYAADAERGDGRLVLVSAEAGGGKSALLDHFSADLPDARWLWAASDGLFTPRPLGPLYDLAEQLGGELLQLCATQAPRDELFRALLRQLIEKDPLERQLSARDALTVVVFEDLHWADEATIDLVRFLARRLRGTRLLILATYRDEGAGPGDALRIAVGELGSQSSTKRLSLQPLSADAVSGLASGSRLDPIALFRLTGGNPFFVTEVVSGGMDSLPASARDAVLARVARLSPAARTVLETAALVGRRVEPDLLARLVPDIAGVEDELAASDLLVEEDSALAFRHELARIAVEQTVPFGRRPSSHARIFAALLQLGITDDARLAFHAEAAGDGAAVLRHAAAAALRAAQVASHRESAAQYERALRFADGAPIEIRATLLERYSVEISLLDRWQDAETAALASLALWREAGDRVREGDLLRKLAGVAWRLCHGADCIEYGEAAVRVLEPLGPSAELAAAYTNRAGDLMMTGRHEEVIAIIGQVREMAEAFGAYDVLSNAMNTEACARFSLGEPWTDLMAAALSMAEQHGFPTLVGRAYTNFLELNAAERNFAEVDRYRKLGLAYCEERDLDVYVACLIGNQVGCWEKTGDWDAAVTAGVTLLGNIASPVNRIATLSALGLIAARRGDPAGWGYLDEAAASTADLNEPEWTGVSGLARTEAAWLEGDVARARTELALVVNVVEFVDRWQRGAVLTWLRRLGSHEHFEGSVAEPFHRALEGEFDEAAQLWLTLSSPVEAAMALYDGGSEAQLRRALTIFDELGATASANRVRSTMRESGVRSIPLGARSATRANASGLTPRESEVLALITRGATNAEIADTLFISQKTVDHHVSAILSKLGTPTRVAAAAEAERLGLVGASAG